MFASLGLKTGSLLRYKTAYRTFHTLLRLLDSVDVAREWVEKLSLESLPLRSFHIRYDRASGPGGQNVNKVNTKCTLTLDKFSTCSLFPDEVRRQLISKKVRMYNAASDSIVIQSDETRSREQNKQLCLNKLVRQIQEGCYFPKEADPKDVKKWQQVRNATKERRLKSKKFNSERKKSRKQMW